MNHYKIKDDILHYDFKKCLEFLQQKGKEHYGDSFQLHADDRKIIYKLIVYFIMDEENCKKHNLDPKKGILLTGPVGCGKTTLMSLMRYFVPKAPPVVIPSREITFEFQQYGFEIIIKYGRQKWAYCFDDLGVEQNLKHYGNECNVMGEILLSRYDLFISQGIKTHATTNLNANELEKMYGARVRSRMRQLFNLISFDQTSIDKRK